MTAETCVWYGCDADRAGPGYLLCATHYDEGQAWLREHNAKHAATALDADTLRNLLAPAQEYARHYWKHGHEAEWAALTTLSRGVDALLDAADAAEAAASGLRAALAPPPDRNNT